MDMFPRQDLGDINHFLLPHTIFNLTSKGKEMVAILAMYLIGRVITKVGVAIKLMNYNFSPNLYNVCYEGSY